MKQLAFIFAVIGISTIFLFNIFNKEATEESIIFFPLDSNIEFSQAVTTLSVADEKDNDEYILKWGIQSDIGKPVYLRQDIGFLFADGKLVDVTSKWKENSQTLTQVKKIEHEDSSHFQAISFHHGEIHYENDVIKSGQKMSADELYVINSPKQPLESFQDPHTDSEKEWKEILDHATNQQLKVSWMNLVKHYNIPTNEYKMIPLTNLAYFNTNPLPNLTIEETQTMIGRLWEGIYKNYLLGLKKEDGYNVSPINSTIPLILFNEDHLIVLIEASNGEYFQLIQYIKS